MQLIRLTITVSLILYALLKDAPYCLMTFHQLHVPLNDSNGKHNIKCLFPEAHPLSSSITIAFEWKSLTATGCDRQQRPIIKSIVMYNFNMIVMCCACSAKSQHIYITDERVIDESWLHLLH